MLSLFCAVAAFAVRGAAKSYNTTLSGLAVDLGYATYQGYYNDTFGLNVWKRFVYTTLS